MSIVKVEQTDMGHGRSHVFIGLNHKQASVEMNIDLSGPDAAVQSVTKDIVAFLANMAPPVAVVSKKPAKTTKAVK